MMLSFVAPLMAPRRRVEVNGDVRSVSRRLLRLRGDEPLESVERLRPTVAVKRAARLGLERALPEGDLRRFAEIPEPQADPGLDVVGIGLLPDEGVGEPDRRVDFAGEGPNTTERAAGRTRFISSVSPSDRAAISLTLSSGLLNHRPTAVVGGRKRRPVTTPRSAVGRCGDPLRPRTRENRTMPESDANPLSGSDLAAFVAAMDAGSVHGAADSLNITPSAVTKLLQSLERRAGVQLFVPDASRPRGRDRSASRIPRASGNAVA
jgi:hypothetical protein